MTTLTSSPAAPASVGATTSKASIFADLDALKVDLKAAGFGGPTEIVSGLQVRKPGPNEFVRVHPGENMTITMVLHEDKDNLRSEYYVISPDMVSEMTELGGAVYAQLYLATTRQGLATIWPIKLPTSGASNPWQESALAAVEAAKANWVRLYADMGRGQYRIFKAEGELEEPQFLEKSLNELLELGFKDRVIKSPDHPICRKLLGRV